MIIFSIRTLKVTSKVLLPYKSYIWSKLRYARNVHKSIAIVDKKKVPSRQVGFVYNTTGPMKGMAIPSSPVSPTGKKSASLISPGLAKINDDEVNDK